MQKDLVEKEEIMDQVPLHYDIKNEEVAVELEKQGFSVYNTTPGCWTMEAPTNISSTKARKIISIIIKLYVAAKELGRAQQKYTNLVAKIDQLNMSR